MQHSLNADQTGNREGSSKSREGSSRVGKQAVRGVIAGTMRTIARSEETGNIARTLKEKEDDR
jgi:hypothetical protein